MNSAGVWALQADGGFTQRADYIENATQVAPAGPPVVGGTASAPTFIYGTNRPSVVRVSYTPGDPGSFDGGVSVTSPLTNAVVTAPVVGSEELYVVDVRGKLHVFDLALGHRWSLDDGISGNDVSSNPNLDVVRDANGQKQCGRGGVLYVASTGDGALYAFVVDSDGLNREAPWPRWQHDPANTGNAATPLTPWTCP